MLILDIRQCRVFAILLIAFACSAKAKVYKLCDLSRELHFTHGIPLDQVATWVCIAQRESLFDTAAVGRLNADGSADHGLFQISDSFWCSHNDHDSKACRLLCSDLLDNDIADDVACIKQIHEEHTLLTGDGFNAWTTYQPFCRSQNHKQVDSCFQGKQPAQGNLPQGSINSIQDTNKLQKKYQNNPFLKNVPVQKPELSTQPQGDASSPQPQIVQAVFANGVSSPPVTNPFLKHVHPHKSQPQSPRYNDISGTALIKVKAVNSSKGKIYSRCSLAQELYTKHNFPLQDVAKWLCIAEHQSSLNTAAVGRQNGDGSANYGLFQISDRYWCSDDIAEDGGKACNVACNKLIDDDLTDDVRCVRTIYDEHTRISGDGFNAWTVYQSRCQNQNIEHIRQCFHETDLNGIAVTLNEIVPSKDKGKIYQSCELAQELYHKHNIPLEQVATWVCIAQHESNFKTAAVGRLNTDGSADHGLFQISDLYWCTHDRYGGKACNIPCDRLLDSDITDDVRCIKIIYDEHTRISGDGFNAWTVYEPHCRNKGMDNVNQCFSEKELKEDSAKSTYSRSINSITPHTAVSSKKGKIYSKCELAQELYHTHHMPMEQIPTWVCIAQHESSYNTAAVGRLNTDGSADHGLFQISDLYWCTHDQYGGKACNIPCDKLLDSDISDDVRCIKFIHDEHTRISGDGFTAWTVYKPHCRNQGMDQVKQCFSEKELKEYSTKSAYSPSSNSITPHTSVSSKKGKIYSKCELAQELYHSHQMPMEQIPTWVCIAQHESSYNTAAVGRLNTDGSADNGLFQISDLYWCTHDQYGGKACNIPCDKLLDSDISDDVRCIKIIHDEHTRISGDGFTAWTVYKPHCRNQGMDQVKQCFSEKELKDFQSKTLTPISTNAIQPGAAAKPSKGKIYTKCELAQELLERHQMPMEQIPTWVCIAQHESSYNTAAVGRLNTDGSADHGLFQISDLFWCTHDQYGGKACNMPCDKLLDSDISDDVKCIKIIHEEHTQLSGDGFNAWTVYKPHCRNRQLQEIRDCFGNNEVELYKENKFKNVIAEIKNPSEFDQYPLSTEIHETTTTTTGHKLKTAGDQKTSSYANNPFLQNAIKIQTTNQKVAVKVSTATDSRTISTGDYKNNPFLNGAIKTTTVSENLKPYKSNTNTYKTNPFLNGSIKTSVAGQHFQDVGKPNYNKNPFLSGSIKTSAVTTSIHSNYNSNPFLAGIVQATESQNQQQTKTPPTVPSVFYQSNSRLENKSQTSKKYLDSNSFRAKNTTTVKSTTTTAKPKTTLNTTTTKRPTATISTTINYKTATSRTTSQKLTTSSDKGTTVKPFTTTRISQVSKATTTKRPITSWSWENEKLKQTTTTKRPTTMSQKLTTSSDKGTTVKPFTTSGISQVSKATTTKPPITSWSWENEKLKQTTTTKRPTTMSQKLTTSSDKGTTVKPFATSKISQVSKATTTKRPITSWSWENEKLKQTTTTKKPTTTNQKLSTSSNKGTTVKPFTTSKVSQVSKATTTKRPITSWSWENQKLKQTTTTKRPTTTGKKLTTSSNKGTTVKPFTTSKISQVSKATTTKRPITSWSWENEKLKQTTTTKRPTTNVQTTIRKPTSAPSTTTTRKPNTTKTTTPQHSTTTKQPATTWSWNDNKTKQVIITTKPIAPFPTLKSITSGTATTKTPTQFISITKSATPTTTRSWSEDNDKLKQKSSTTTKKPATSPTTAKTPTASWTTTRNPITTIKPITTPKTTTLEKYPTKPYIITTTQSWHSGQRYKQTSLSTTKNPTTSLKPATQKAWTTTAKTPIPTIKAATSWSWNNAKQQHLSSTTTSKPQTSTSRTNPTKSSTIFTTSTKKFVATQRTTTNLPTITWSSAWEQQKHAATAIKSSRLQTSTQKLSKLQISTAKIPQSQTTSTKRPTTRATWNWQQPIYANSTAITKTTSKHTTTSWKSKTTTPRTAIYTDHKPLKTSSTTRKPQTTTLSWLSRKLTATTKPLPSNSWNARVGSNNKNNNRATTTKAPATKILRTTKVVTTTKASKLQATTYVGQNKITKPTNEPHKTTTATTKTPSIIDNYRKDPFSHPFFDKVKYQLN